MQINKKAIIEGMPEPFLKIWFRRVGGLFLGFFLLNFFVLAVLTFIITAPVDMVQYKNSTDPSGKTFEMDDFEDGKIPDGYEMFLWYGGLNEKGEFVGGGYELDEENKLVISKVPYSNIPKWVFFLLFFINLVILIAKGQKPEEGEGISSEDALDIVKEWLEKSKLRGDFKGKAIFNDPLPDVRLIRKTIGEKSIKDRYVIPFKVEWEDRFITCYLAELDYQTGHFIGRAKLTEGEFMRHDTCGNCGRYADERIRTTAELEQNLNLLSRLGGSKK